MTRKIQVLIATVLRITLWIILTFIGRLSEKNFTDSNFDSLVQDIINTSFSLLGYISDTEDIVSLHNIGNIESDELYDGEKNIPKA